MESALCVPLIHEGRVLGVLNLHHATRTDAFDDDDLEFAERLLKEERVAVIPGRFFGESGAGFVRCCYATSYEQIEEALERMQRFMRRHG